MMLSRLVLKEQLRALLKRQQVHHQSSDVVVQRCFCDTFNSKSKNNIRQPFVRVQKLCTLKTNKINAQIEITEDLGLSHEDQEHSEHSEFSVKSILYDEDADEIVRQLNACYNYEKLLDIVNSGSSAMELKHWVQSTVCLWALYNNKNEEPPDDLVIAISNGLKPHIHALNENEVSCCLLYLRRLKARDAQLIKDLETTATLELECTTVSLEALSRLSVALNQKESVSKTIQEQFRHHVTHHLEKCTTAEQIRLLSICILNQNALKTVDILELLKAKIQELLDNGTLNASSIKTIPKLLNLLNLPIWSSHNLQMIRKLMLALNPSIGEISEYDLKVLCRIFQHHLEPAAMEDSLRGRIRHVHARQPSPDTLACLIPFSGPVERESLIPDLKNLLVSEKEWQQRNASGSFFTALRGLKISNTNLCDTYWERVLNRLYENLIREENNFRFLRHCHRYMHFNNNLGGTYRYLPLERKLSQMCMDMVEHHPDGTEPAKFARLAAFVMAYGHTPYAWKKYPNTLLSKIIALSQKFSMEDVYFLSRGLNISTELRFRYHAPSSLTMQLDTIDNILAERVEAFLQNDEPLTIASVNTIVRILGNRRNLKNTTIYQLALSKYKEVDLSDLNSRVIRDLAYCFLSTNHIEPKVLEAMISYIEANHEHVLGETLEKVLSCCYNLGYSPESQTIYEYAAKILMRDFELMSGLSIVQACLALCYYKTIPEELINRVFCVNFIKRVEDEIQMCYSKATYPERVLNLVMQLNRTVCLDFPEASVPWFQQNYIEAQLSKKPFVASSFNNDVKKLLVALLKDETYFRCNHTTPYGYQIDFVIHFDRDRKLLPAPAETTVLDRITKVAILLLRLDSFCENDLTRLRGPELLKIKHLEMMGYKVLHINEHDWNSKYMNAPGAKTNYLKCLLQISS